MLKKICARLLRSRLFAANQVVCDRGRGEYRRVSTDQHAEQQREDEPRITSPPNRKMASNTTNVVPEVLIVRVSVELIALLMLS